MPEILTTILQRICQQVDAVVFLVRGRREREGASRTQHEKWTHWDLNPGPSACEADVIPLHHVPIWLRKFPMEVHWYREHASMES